MNLNDKQIIFGSMRIDEHSYSDIHWIELFNFMYDNGVQIHHVSSEYGSYDRYCAILKKFKNQYPKKKIHHIVKLAEPHFSDTSFNPNSFINKIENYKEQLLTKEIYIIQWMWRRHLKDDSNRLKNFDKKYKIIERAIGACKKRGDIKYFYCFPYTLDFAQNVLKKDIIDGLVLYRNIFETEFDQIIYKCGELGKKCITIRPLAAGRALKVNNSLNELMNFCFNISAVSGVIVSISTIQRFQKIFNVFTNKKKH